MARANTYTKLSLERWSEIMGVHPFHFNGLYSDNYMPDTVCGMTWHQYAWQHADRISREELAIAIHDAERDIEGLLGYFLLPTWVTGERLRMPRPALRELFNADGRNVRGQRQSVQTRHGWVITGGVRVKTGIETAAVTRSDADGDGFSELCTVTVGTSIENDDEIRVYLPGRSGADEYEVRPITVSLDTDANTATITFKVWQIVDPDQQEYLNSAALDAEDDTIYETTVDVYRVYNDPQTQIQFVWEKDTYLPYESCGSTTCIACQLGTQTGCFHNRDDRLGIIVPAPATWSSANSQFTAQRYSVCRGPDQARIWYLSGNRDLSYDRPRNDMEKYWETAVAYLAAARLGKPTCGCNNVTAFIEHWQEMREFSSRETGTYFQTPAQLTNPLGSTNGAKYAFEKVSKPGRRLGTQR